MSIETGDGVYKKLMAPAKVKYMMLISPCNYLGHFSPISIVGVHHGPKVQVGDHLDVKVGLENLQTSDL